MKRTRRTAVVAVVVAVLLSVLSIGIASAWFFEKDPITLVNPAGNEAVTENIYEVPGEGTVDAIVVSSLEWCALGDVAEIPGLFGHVIFDCDTDPVGVFLAASDSISGGTLTVQFVPSSGNWGDVFPEGTVIACITGDVVGDDWGLRAGFEWEPLCQELGVVDTGRMTGGGSIFYDNSPAIRVTRGFEIHCDLSVPNKLQVNEHGGAKLKFHLEVLTAATCTDEPGYNEIPPPAGFDTFVGTGTGKLDGVENAGDICFRFEDHGEPGIDDVATIAIWPLGTGPAVCTDLTAAQWAGVGGELLYVSGPMHHGNLQAHKDS